MFHLMPARRQRLDFEKMCELISERTTLNTYESGVYAVCFQRVDNSIYGFLRLGFAFFFLSGRKENIVEYQTIAARVGI